MPSLDTKGTFYSGFRNIQTKLERRAYTTVASFFHDLGNSLRSVLFACENGQADSAMQYLGPRDPREIRKIAKRIAKAVQPLINDAGQKEAALAGKPADGLEQGNLELLLEQKEPVQSAVQLGENKQGVALPWHGDITIPDGPSEGDERQDIVGHAVNTTSLTHHRLDGENDDVGATTDEINALPSPWTVNSP